MDRPQKNTVFGVTLKRRDGVNVKRPFSLAEYLMSRRRLALGVAALLIWGFAFHPWVRSRTPYQRMEWALLDFQFLERGALPPPDNIVFLGVMESSLLQLGFDADDSQAHPALGYMNENWPWDRRFFAHVVERLDMAELLVFDFVFAKPVGDGDWDFADAILEESNRMVLGSMILDYQDPNGGRVVSLLTPLEDLLPPPPKDEGLLGFVNVDPDHDKVVRRIAHAQTLLGRQSPAFANLAPDQFSLAFQAVFKGALKPDLAPFTERRLINYSGPERSIPTYPIEFLFLPDRWENIFEGGRYFDDKVVVIGPHFELQFKDYHNTPFGSMPGAEIQAQLIREIADDIRLTELGGWALALLGLAVLGLAFWLIERSSNPWVKGVIVLGLMGLVAVGAQYAFEVHLLVIPLFGLFFSLASYGSVDIVFNYALEQLEKRRVRGVLDRYVSANVAEAILRNSKDFEERLKGQTQNVTIFFSDIRGFTTLTEKAKDSPEAFVDQLNEYFYSMVELVYAEDGTLQKFIGDAIMAVWGDTHSRGEEHDAAAAVRCALRMNQAMVELNKQWKGLDNRGPLQVGIGINTGEAIVGNIGHPRRMEFTVLGDAVNLASRLEGATKYTFQPILVGEDVYRLTNSEFVYRHVDRLRVKGRSIGVNVYTPLALAGETPPPWLKVFHRGLERYFERDFEQAIELFNDVLSQAPSDELSRAYLERCDRLIANPPPADWDGAYVLEGK